MKTKNLFFYLLLIISVGCEPVYKASNYKELADTHKIIAVLPPKVNIEIKSSKDATIIKEQENLEANRFQKALVDYVNLHNSKGDFFVKAQDAVETNRILAENNIVSLAGRNYQDLAKLLNVDAVVTSRVSLSKPLTNAEAFFTSILASPFNADSKINTVDLSLTDKNSGKMFWNYNWQIGGTFTSSERLTNSLMKSAAYRFPYKTKDLK